MIYNALAQVYDELTANVDYRHRASFIHRTFKTNNIKGIVLDAGCGTGTLTLLLAAKGYDMIGVDASRDMLSIATQKAANTKYDITFLHQKLEDLDLYGTVKGIVCMQDTFNHFGSDLSKVIEQFALFLEKDGVLIFDINTKYKHREVLADNSFIYELADDGMCVWQNRYEKLHKRVRVKVDVFIKEEEDTYGRITDDFYEYDINTERLGRLLEQQGFEIQSILDGETYDVVTETTQRILYTVVKRE